MTDTEMIDNADASTATEASPRNGRGSVFDTFKKEPSSPPWERQNGGEFTGGAPPSDVEKSPRTDSSDETDPEIFSEIWEDVTDVKEASPGAPVGPRPLLDKFTRLRDLALRKRKPAEKPAVFEVPSEDPSTEGVALKSVSAVVPEPPVQTAAATKEPDPRVENGKKKKRGGASGWGFLGLEPGGGQPPVRDAVGGDRESELAGGNAEMTEGHTVTAVSRSLLELRSGTSENIQLSGQEDWKTPRGNGRSSESPSGRESSPPGTVEGSDRDTSSLPSSRKELGENENSGIQNPRIQTAEGKKSSARLPLSTNRTSNDQARSGAVETLRDEKTETEIDPGLNGVEAAPPKSADCFPAALASPPEEKQRESGNRVASRAEEAERRLSDALHASEEAARKKVQSRAVAGAVAGAAEADHRLAEVIAEAEERIQREAQYRAELRAAEAERRLAEVIADAEERVRKKARIQAEARSSELEDRLTEAVAKIEERARAAEHHRTEIWTAEVEEQLADTIARTKERLRTEERLRAEANVAEAERRLAQAIAEAEEQVCSEVRAAAAQRIREGEILGAKALAEAKKQARTTALEEVWEWIRSEERARKRAIEEAREQVRAEVAEEGERLARADADNTAEAVAKAERNARTEVLTEVEGRVRAAELAREQAVAEAEERVRAEVTVEGERLLEGAEQATAEALTEAEARVRSEWLARYRKQKETAERERIREIAAVEERIRAEVAAEETKVLRENRENLVRDLEETGKKARILALVEARERIREEEARNQKSIAEAESRVRAEVAAETKKVLEADACIVTKAIHIAEKKAREEALSIAREQIRSQELANAKALREAEIRAREEIEGEAELRLRAEVDATVTAMAEAETRARAEALAEVRSHSLSDERIRIQEIMEVEERVRASVFAEAEIAARATREREITAAAERARIEAEAEVEARKSAAARAEHPRKKKENSRNTSSRSNASRKDAEENGADQIEDLASVLGQFQTEERAKAENRRRRENGGRSDGETMSSIPLPPVDRRSGPEKRARAREEMSQKIQSYCQGAGDRIKSSFHTVGGTILSVPGNLARPFRRVDSQESTDLSGERTSTERENFERSVEDALSSEEGLSKETAAVEESGGGTRFPIVPGTLLLVLIAGAISIPALLGEKRTVPVAIDPFGIALERFEKGGIYFGFEGWKYDTAGRVDFDGITLYRDREKAHPHFHASSALVELPAPDSAKPNTPGKSGNSADAAAPLEKIALSLPGAELTFYDDGGKVAVLFADSRGILEIEPGKMVMRHFESIAGGVKVKASGPYLLPRDSSDPPGAMVPGIKGEGGSGESAKKPEGPLFSAVLSFFSQGKTLFEGVTGRDTPSPVLTLTSDFETTPDSAPAIAATLLGEEFEWGGVSFQSVDATFHVKGDGSQVHIQNFQIGREGKYVGGEFTVDFERKEIEIEKIHSTADLPGLLPALDLHWIGPELRQAIGALRFVDTPTVRLSGKIPFTPTGAPTLELAYEDPAGFVHTRGGRELAVRELKGIIEVGPAGLRSSGFSAALFGGHVGVEGKHPFGNEAPPFDGNLRATGISLADTAQFFGFGDYGLSGTLDLEHEGEGTRDPYRVSGGGDFQIEGAQLVSFPILGRVRDYLREINPAFEFADKSSLAGHYTIEFGVLGLKEITVRGNESTLIMDGSLNLANRKSDFRVRAFLDGPLAAKAGLKGKEVELRGVGDLAGPTLTVTRLPEEFAKTQTAGSPAAGSNVVVE